MSAEADLLASCRWALDDDGPRLVWADAVGGDRGELVVIQCELARGGLAPARAGALRRRERELLAMHGDEWAGLGDFDCRYELRRGFVEAIELDARTFAEQGEEIFRRAPLLRSLTATGLTLPGGENPIDRLRELIESPSFWRLHGLDLTSIAVEWPGLGLELAREEGLGNEAARLLANSGALVHLDALGISSSGLTAAGVHHLVASGELQHLERLRLHGDELGADAVRAVLAAAPRVKSLDLGGTADVEAFVAALPPVVELHLSGLEERTFAALATSRAAATVERLRLSSSTLSLDDGFRAFPRLRELDLHRSRIRGPMPEPRALTAALPVLRRLRFPSSASTADVLLVGRALGPQLEQLDLRDHAHRPGLIDALEVHVAGELLTGELEPEWLPL